MNPFDLIVALACRSDSTPEKLVALFDGAQNVDGEDFGVRLGALAMATYLAEEMPDGEKVKVLEVCFSVWEDMYDDMDSMEEARPVCVNCMRLLDPEGAWLKRSYLEERDDECAAAYKEFLIACKFEVPERPVTPPPPEGPSASVTAEPT